ncbi:SRPBCC domain-containing protein [Nitrospirillum sp. BR 11163]|uniref:SRPBCC family protein n=1 Tax=Nitrospirillum sp. BR 11163 TaxID=3104323 RepID=UPI002AFF78AA|nr:SRPBCC domain-containing protein [Nitrospirillum sp. BR 11163]MEA1676258.1 SRPBCC domain-containing protein [Nitrospirillum sp. BR 11163]
MTGQDPITMAALISAPPGRVWAALTAPALMARWMADEPVAVTADWRAGGAITIGGTLHGMAFENRGVIEVFEPATAFQYAYWSSLSAARLADRPQNRTRVRFDLAAAEGGTSLALTLRDFPEPSIRPHAQLYWGPTLNILKRVAEEG